MQHEVKANGPPSPKPKMFSAKDKWPTYTSSLGGLGGGVGEGGVGKKKQMAT